MKHYELRQLAEFAKRISNREKREAYIFDTDNWVTVETTAHVRLRWLPPVAVFAIERKWSNIDPATGITRNEGWRTVCYHRYDALTKDVMHTIITMKKGVHPDDGKGHLYKMSYEVSVNQINDVLQSLANEIRLIIPGNKPPLGL
jgi:hypothetical protein